MWLNSHCPADNFQPGSFHFQIEVCWAGGYPWFDIQELPNFAKCMTSLWVWCGVEGGGTLLTLYWKYSYPLIHYFALIRFSNWLIFIVEWNSFHMWYVRYYPFCFFFFFYVFFIWLNRFSIQQPWLCHQSISEVCFWLNLWTFSKMMPLWYCSMEKQVEWFNRKS